MGAPAIVEADRGSGQAAMTLRCLHCVGTSSTCRMVARKCPTYETTCLSLAYRTQDGSNTVMKGCATTELCNQTSIIDTGTRSIYMTSSCCESDYCNLNRFSTSRVYSNRIQCNACNSSSSSCRSMQPIFCDEVNNNCVDVVSRDINGSVSNTSYIKGCGAANFGDACTNLFSFNTGTYQRHTYMSCCNNDNLCNKAQKSIPILTNRNGITCYGCKENGNGECMPQNQTQVACQGTLLRCMEVFDENRKTIMKGCSTVAFCSSTDLTQQRSSISEIMCCAGSLCNNFTRELSSEFNNNNNNTSTSSTASRSTDFSILAAFICLISAIMTH